MTLRMNKYTLNLSRAYGDIRTGRRMGNLQLSKIESEE